ncbi:MAG TPA: hypothetical protein PLV68_14065, partial [Ilumatobacteraceae bacterium]|nr:hypothetical protein [Ilumatobacteraceae bacterium]
WVSMLTRVYVTISTGQLAAAALADPYVSLVLAEQDIDTDRAASLSALAFAGRASDGRSLEGLLVESVIRVKTLIASGADVTTALRSGEASLLRIVTTQVADAGRTAVGTATVARPAATKWVRMLNPPSCSRCALLAGKVYRWNQGFRRHPHCDCVHIPSTESIAGDLTTDPAAYFNSLTAADQDRYFTVAGAQAIRDGADIGQVVNARRRGAMYQANERSYTREGTTVRGFAGSRIGGTTERLSDARYSSVKTGRPMPETIYGNATDRAEAVGLLRRYGYLVAA